MPDGGGGGALFPGRPGFTPSAGHSPGTFPIQGKDKTVMTRHDAPAPSLFISGRETPRLPDDSTGCPASWPSTFPSCLS